jgi:hypothetical protein
MKSNFPDHEICYPLSKPDLPVINGNMQNYILNNGTNIRMGKDQKIIVFCPSLPPSKNIKKSNIYKIYLDVYDEYGINSVWQGLFPEKIRYLE